MNFENSQLVCEAKQMESFDQLPRTEKRRRLRKLGKKALSNFGIDQANLKLVSDSTNFVFRVDTKITCP
jgi:hypothetical protein